MTASARSGGFRRLLAPLSVLFVCLGLPILLAGACSHEITSPELRPGAVPGAVEPSLVCSGQSTSGGEKVTGVVLRGEGFTPMPTKTLEGPTTLVLPKVELLQAEHIDGGALKNHVLPDDPVTKTGAVHFTSDKEMSFDVSEPLGLEGGVYGVRVTNPDGTHVAAWDRSLAVVPPPVLTEVTPGAICVDQFDQDLTIVGQYFLRVTRADGTVLVPTLTVAGQVFDVKELAECRALTGSFLEKSIEVCSRIVITVPQGSLEPGVHDVVVTNPPPADCVATTPIQVQVNPPPVVDSAVPATICAGGSALTISGSNFFALPDGTGPKVELRPVGGALDVVPATSVACLEDCAAPGGGHELEAFFGPGAVPGQAYEVVVTNPDGCQDEAPHVIVTGVDGPILFFVDPFVVPSSVNTRITLYATAIAQPLPDPAVWIVPAGQTEPMTELQTLPVDPNFPRRVQAIVPKGTPAGTYDVFMRDATTCSAVLPEGLVVAAEPTLSLLKVEPPFGDAAEATPITIFRDVSAPAPANEPFVSTPRVFLNPAASTNPPADAVAIQVGLVSMVDPDTLTGVVPGANAVPPGVYDVLVVNPTGEVGVLSDGYASLSVPPPAIDSVSPQSIAASDDQTLTIEGEHFRAGATVALSCVDAQGNPLPPLSPEATGEPSCDAGGESCTMSATFDATPLSAGSVCVVRVTNTDGSYADFSAVGVTTPALNLATPDPGSDMVVGRRGLVSGAVKATSAARFVYAIGGDDGGSTVFDSVEAAPVDLYGKMGPFSLQRSALGAPRAFAGAQTAGRYLYVGGGRTSGGGALASVERALVLSPREAPFLADVDLVLGEAGLPKGQWFYKVSAIFDPADTDNPGGESLPSDEFVLRLPEIPNKKIAVELRWVRPKDERTGEDVPGVVGYRIYRTAEADGASGGEVLLDTVSGAETLTYLDDGSKAPGAETPLPLGSTGSWASLPAMSTPRDAVAYALAADPASPETKLYLYAFFGKNGGSLLGSYELLPITVAPSGRHAVGAWTAGTATGEGRVHHGAWVVDRSVHVPVGQPPNDPDTTLVYVGGGSNGGSGFVLSVLRGRVQAGGQLDALAPTESFPAGGFAGYGTLSAASQLFVFGGAKMQPNPKGVSAQIVDAEGTLANNAWNAGLNLNTGRVFMGSSVQSAFAFFLGGQTDASPASRSTELVVW